MLLGGKYNYGVRVNYEQTDHASLNQKVTLADFYCVRIIILMWLREIGHLFSIFSYYEHKMKYRVLVISETINFVNGLYKKM